MTLGQELSSFSGGEAQRLKLLSLDFSTTGSFILIFDEPTTGLSEYDVSCLLKHLNDFVNTGHTVVIVEHNLQVIAQADWIIEIGPEAGQEGGSLVCEGAIQDIMKNKNSNIASYL